jgi:hypothetical protein
MCYQWPIGAASLVAERIAETWGSTTADVVTTRLVLDERGWLRLVG